MSEFSTGYRTMERRLRDTEDRFGDSETLIQSVPSSPDMWSRSSRTNSNATDSGVSREHSTLPREKYDEEKTVHFPPDTDDFKMGNLRRFDTYANMVEAFPTIRCQSDKWPVVRGPVEQEDGEQGEISKEEFPDWRRSAVLTIFIFPPTGLVAMVLACLSHRSAKNGDYNRARRLNCCSCWLVFISLLASLLIIMFVILLRLYGYIDDPF